MRIAFMGPRPLLETCAPSSAEGLEPIELTPSADSDQVRASPPDAVVAFAPSAQERALVDELDLPTLIWFSREGESPMIGELRPSQRLIADDPRDHRLWRSVPLPVADRLYDDSAPPSPWRAGWLNPETERRADHLAYFKGDTGIIADCSATATAIAVNMHDDERPSCEHRALCALAGGRLLVSETLEPSRGLEPGLDYLAAKTLDDLFLAAEHASKSPESFRRVRLRGRRKSELFRASRVIPRLVGDLALELGAG